MSCKVIISAEKIHDSYCIVSDDLEYVSEDLYKLPGVDIHVDEVSRAVFKNTNAKAFVAIKKNVLIKGKEIYSLRPLGKDLYKKYERKQMTDDDIEKKYSPQEKLGEGTYGMVEYYPEENVVVKTMKTDYADIPQDMVKEIALYSFLWKIACLPKMYGFSPKKKKLVFERGVKTLTEVADSVPLDAQRVLMFRLVKCMRSIARQGIIHCDLKPPNIVVMDDGEIQVIDWGIAVIDRSKGQTMDKNTNVQTLWYRAPEIFLEMRDYSHKIDIYSLGWIFCFMNTTIVLRGDDESQLKIMLYFLLGIDKERLQDESDVQSELESAVNGISMHDVIKSNLLKRKFVKDDLLADLVARMLEFNPKNRISYDQIIIHPFFQNMRRKNVPKMKRFLNNMPIIPDISSIWNGKVSIKTRKTLFAWMGDVALRLNSQRALCLSFQLMDLYVMNDKKVSTRNVQMYSCAAMYLATNLLYVAILPDDFVYLSANSFTIRNLVNASNKMLKVLNGDILIATLWDYIVSSGREMNVNEMLKYYLRPDIYARPFSQIVSK
uniref:Protein kinase domain-containing protein n=1 Tax=viral metagenome TaxID=1070528 RepID=A0A6C0ELM9_9ZZZZ